jgi:ATP-dependent helicase HrpB
VQSLPIDAILPSVLENLRARPNLVIEAPPGAGKTTRVPASLMQLGGGSVVVLEPRRLAARMAARRVASELGEPVGRTVGFQVRFEECGGPETRLWYWTEGVLTRRLLSDPNLDEAGVVVLDEFHERHIDTDLALAFVRRLQRKARPDLRIVVMSATLNASPIAKFLDGAVVLRAEGRLHPIEIEYTPHGPLPVERQVASAFERLLSRGIRGDVLTFLPGAAEIRRAARECAGAAERAGFATVTLHGDLTPAEQDRAVLPGPQPKLILSTNVAESSITIEGVVAVIDSGLARVAVDSPWTGLPSLNVSRISKASAKQRAGRAGRLRAGRVIRLYSEDDYARRAENETPEILRRELSHVLLDLHAMHAGDIDWFEPPPAEAMAAARALLLRLGAIDGEQLTPTGREMVRLPLHPRLARMVVEAQRRGAGEAGCAAAAALAAGDRIETVPVHPAESDLFILVEREWPHNTRRIYEQVKRAIRVVRPQSTEEDALLIAVLAGFPDRVARKRQGNEYLLAGGGSAILAETSAVAGAEFIVALDLDVRRDRVLPLIRLASAIRPEWLIDLYPERVADRTGVEWNRVAERVEAVSALVYDGLTIDENRGAMPDPVLASALLAEKAIAAGVERFVDREELDALRSRAAFAAERSGLHAVTDEEVADALRQLCEGKRSFQELEKASLVEALRARLPHRAKLDEIAPERIRLPGGRLVRVHYEEGKPPWVESRLQDFFGMRETPRVGGVPVVVHLLAPNHRPVQMTSDLGGFWERLYPQVRKELSRRYPKHAWPERP